MTTTDPFATAAREEAETRWPEWPLGHAPERFAFVAGAKWAQDRLAAQEPTDACRCGRSASDPLCTSCHRNYDHECRTAHREDPTR